MISYPVYRNDSEETLPKSMNREELATFIQSSYQSVRELKTTGEGYDYTMNRKAVDDPEMVPLESLDLYSNKSLN